MTNERTTPGPATARDTAAGYSVCMFCEETGDYAGHAGHDVLWDRWEEEAAMQFRAMEEAEGTTFAATCFPDTAERLGVDALEPARVESAGMLEDGEVEWVDEDDWPGPEGPTCSLCDALGHGYPGGGPCPLEERGREDARRDEERFGRF